MGCFLASGVVCGDLGCGKVCGGIREGLVGKGGGVRGSLSCRERFVCYLGFERRRRRVLNGGAKGGGNCIRGLLRDM